MRDHTLRSSDNRRTGVIILETPGRYISKPSTEEDHMPSFYLWTSKQFLNPLQYIQLERRIETTVNIYKTGHNDSVTFMQMTATTKSFLHQMESSTILLRSGIECHATASIISISLQFCAEASDASISRALSSSLRTSSSMSSSSSSSSISSSSSSLPPTSPS